MNRGSPYLPVGEPTASRRAPRHGIEPLVSPPSEPAAAPAAGIGPGGPIARGPETEIERRFHDLARQWREATYLLSSITEKAMHPAYQQIIGMGREVLPLLLQELRREPGHWFWALKAITGEDPVPPADRGKMRRMAEAWLTWARDRGY